MNRLLDEVEVLETTGDPSVVAIRGIEHDSRRVAEGDLFCCLPGLTSDGHLFAREAVTRGAAGILCEHLVDGLDGVVQARVPAGSARTSMARLAAAFYGFPARDLLTVGVTGTNGKTTVTQLLAAVLRHVGHPTLVVGTLSGARTTPEASELQRLMGEHRDRLEASSLSGAVAMEVSSHALAQSRVDGIHFDVAVFTNLSHDHLDYHATMEEYFAAKSKLFRPDRAVQGIVNADDEWGQRLLLTKEIPMVAVRRSDASEVSLALGHTTFVWRGEPVQLRLTGAINLDNALFAAEAALALGLTAPDIAAGLATASIVPGRMEVVSNVSAPIGVLVDYAHTPAALESALRDLRALGGSGRVIVVFGCGGNRDTTKRPEMGEVASRLADLVVLTSDNPRNEDPAAIIAAVESGISPDARRGDRLFIEPDRRTAIAHAISAARAGDVVLVAGKGHEEYQEIGGHRWPFDDRQVTKELLEEALPGSTSNIPSEEPRSATRSVGD